MGDQIELKDGMQRDQLSALKNVSPCTTTASTLKSKDEKTTNKLNNLHTNPNSQQRKRKRLNAVLDKISNHIGARNAKVGPKLLSVPPTSSTLTTVEISKYSSSGSPKKTKSELSITPVANKESSKLIDAHDNEETRRRSKRTRATAANNTSHNNTSDAIQVRSRSKMFGRTERSNVPPPLPARGSRSELPPAAHQQQRAEPVDVVKQHNPVERKLSSAALRRELWRDNQQQSVEEHHHHEDVSYSKSRSTDDRDSATSYLHTARPTVRSVSPLVQQLQPPPLPPRPPSHPRSPYHHAHPPSQQQPQQQTLTQHPEQQQQKLTQHPEHHSSQDVFKFDSFDRDRLIPVSVASLRHAGRSLEYDNRDRLDANTARSYLPHQHSDPSSHLQPYPSTNSGRFGTSPRQPSPLSSQSCLTALGGSITVPDEVEETFSPASGRSPHSSMSSPQVSVDSPRICFSPLRIKDSIEEEEGVVGVGSVGTSLDTGHIILQHQLPKLSVRGCDSEESSSSPVGQTHVGIAGHHPLPPPSTSIGGGVASGSWLDAPATHHQRHYHDNKLLPGMPPSLSRPISPNPSITPTTPISPSTPLHVLKNLPAYLSESYRRRCMSDTDLSSSWTDSQDTGVPKATNEGTRNHLKVRVNSSEREHTRNYACASPLPHQYSATGISGSRQRYLPFPTKGGSLESETSSSTTQESPLDLSVRSSVSSTTSYCLRTALTASMDNIQLQQPIKHHIFPNIKPGQGRSRSTGIARGSHSADRYPDRYSLDRLDAGPAGAGLEPIVTNVGTVGNGGAAGVAGAATGTNPEVAYVCPICGQMFALHDRLAKHMASRHKSRSTDSGTKAYMCDECKRSFARSDMLTRHMRLHTGIKPYMCRTCNQVFSRSDHLSTHQRTHTGEKPYRCPSCPYAACRRDMITRHMRTHARYEMQDSTSIEDAVTNTSVSLGGTDSPLPRSGSRSLGSGPGTSRSVSSESEPPLQQQQQQQVPVVKPPSPMDTEEEGANKKPS